MLLKRKLETLNILGRLEHKRILITGATGLIGKSLVRSLAELNEKAMLKLEIVILVRNISRIDPQIKKYILDGTIQVIVGDITGDLALNKDKVDYIIHAASITDSKAMIEYPVEVIDTNFRGTNKILRFARDYHAESVVYLSSMEAYGFTEKETLLTEDDVQYLNPLKVRSSYPESKRMCENLCVSFFSEYSIPVKIVRLAQTFGRGVVMNDNRVFADFARRVVSNTDIILATDGTSKRMYVDIDDAISAIIVVLIKGTNGEAYNVANKKTYCSISDMANLVAHELANDKISVKYEINEMKKKQFSPPHRLLLDTGKIEKLGWEAEYGLLDMYKKMLEGWS